MKTSTLAGILVVAGIGIGALLSSILPEFPGLGTGWNGFGNPPGKEPPVADSKSTDKTTEDKEEEASEPPTPVARPVLTSSNGESEPPPEVVYVVISGRDYLIRQAPEDRLTQRRVALPEVIQAVQDAPGNMNGVKVRIIQLTTARASALRALKQALENAKIPRDAIRTVDEPIEESNGVGTVNSSKTEAVESLKEEIDNPEVPQEATTRTVGTPIED